MFDIDTRARTAVRVMNGHRGHSVFYGVAYSPDGRRAWASGGGQDVLHVYRVTAGGLKLRRTGDPGRQLPGRDRLRSHPARRPPVRGRTTSAGRRSRPGPTRIRPGTRSRVINPNTSQVTATIDLGLPLDPFGVTFNRPGTKAYVTQLDRPLGGRDRHAHAAARRQRSALAAGDPLQADHPTAIAADPTHDELYTANASSDTVSVIDGRRRPAGGHDRRRPRARLRRRARCPRASRSAPTAARCTSPTRARTRSRSSTSRTRRVARLHPDRLVSGRRQRHPRTAAGWWS